MRKRRLSGCCVAVNVHFGSSARLLEAADPLCSGRIPRAGEATTLALVHIVDVTSGESQHSALQLLNCQTPVAPRSRTLSQSTDHGHAH